MVKASHTIYPTPQRSSLCNSNVPSLSSLTLNRLTIKPPRTQSNPLPWLQCSERLCERALDSNKLISSEISRTFNRVDNFIKRAVPKEVREWFYAAIHWALDKLRNTIWSIKLDHKNELFDSYLDSLLTIQKQVQEAQMYPSISSVWVLYALESLLVILCTKTALHESSMVALSDILATVRSMAVKLPEDLQIAATIMCDYWPHLEILMASDQPEVAFHAFRTAKAVILNVPLPETLQAITNLGVDCTGHPEADKRLYRYRVDILQAIIERIYLMPQSIDGSISDCLLRYAHKLEQLQGGGNPLLFDRTRDVLWSVKRVCHQKP